MAEFILVYQARLAYTGCMESIWSKISCELEQTIDEARYKVWIAPLKAGFREGELEIEARNEFAARFIRSNYLNLIARAAAGVLGEAPRISVKSGSGRDLVAKTADVPANGANGLCPSRPGGSAGEQPPVAAQAELPLGWAQGDMCGEPDANRLVKAWRHSFDDFVVGPCNELAHAAARSICDNHSCFGSVLFLCSGSGLGKTHLMQSVGQGLLRSSNFYVPRVEYLTAEEFTSHLWLAMRSGEIDRFKARFRETDVLLLEDVHFLQEKKKTEGEMLATVTALLNRGSKVVFSSSFAPRDLRKMDGQLLSRFSSGMIACIDKPDMETRRRIISAKASAHKVQLSEDVTGYLAEAMHADIRQIESCIQNLALKARFFNRAVTLDMARETAANYLDSVTVVNLPEIVRMVCQGFGISEEALNSRSRKQEYVQARNTAFYLARKHTMLSLQDIGRQFNRTHSTVIKGITSLEREISRQSHSGRQLASTISLIEENAKITRSA